MTPNGRKPLRGRRKKACDLCFTKKLKCDLAEPDCSNCKIYGSDCRRPASRPHDGQGHEVAGLRDNPPQPLRSSQDSSSDGDVSSCRWTFDAIKPTLYYGPPDKHMSLPPLEEIIPIIDRYFEHTNPYEPLFNRESFMAMLTGWFRVDATRSSASWAAILVVVAMGLEAPSPQPFNRDTVRDTSLRDYCMRNAQSVILPELVMRDEDLLGLQVLVGLALLFRNSPDMKPSFVLVGMAIRLSHRMQLHRVVPRGCISEQEALDRSNAFWVMYMLEKDLSFKLKTPSALADDTLPIVTQAVPSDMTGSRSDKEQFFMFHQRVELARIQGDIFNRLYAAEHIPAQQSAAEQVDTLQRRLESWYHNMPAHLRPDSILGTVPLIDSLYLTHMYGTYLECLISTHGVWSKGSEWLQKIGSLGRAAAEDFAAAIYGSKVYTTIRSKTPPLPQAWSYCVRIARETIPLLQDAVLTQDILWQHNCPHFSGLIIILADISFGDPDGYKDQDLQLAQRSTELFHRRLDGVSSKAYESMYLVIQDLESSAVKRLAGAEPDKAYAAAPAAVSGADFVFDGDGEYFDQLVLDEGWNDILAVDG